MTKAEIVSQIAKTTGQDKNSVYATVEAFMEVVKESMCQKENVYLRGFGTFVVKERAAKLARNIKANTTVEVPAHFIAAFKPSKEFVIK